jgi:hypothetical protein
MELEQFMNIHLSNSEPDLKVGCISIYEVNGIYLIYGSKSIGRGLLPLAKLEGENNFSDNLQEAVNIALMHNGINPVNGMPEEPEYDKSAVYEEVN